jgi:hypothetical protein
MRCSSVVGGGRSARTNGTSGLTNRWLDVARCGPTPDTTPAVGLVVIQMLLLMVHCLFFSILLFCYCEMCYLLMCSFIPLLCWLLWYSICDMLNDVLLLTMSRWHLILYCVLLICGWFDNNIDWWHFGITTIDYYYLLILLFVEGEADIVDIIIIYYLGSQWSLLLAYCGIIQCVAMMTVLLLLLWLLFIVYYYYY